MIKARRWIGLLLSVLCVGMASGFVLAETDLERQYQQDCQELSKQSMEGKITNDEYMTQTQLLSLRYQKTLHTEVSAALDELSESRPNTEEQVLAARTALLKQDSQNMKQYFAESNGTTAEQITQEPVYTISDAAIPLCDTSLVAAANKGRVSVENLRKYVCAWTFVGYADGNPFCVFQVRPEGKDYVCSIAFPSPETAAVYDRLLSIPECYTEVSLISGNITYCVVENDAVSRIETLNRDTNEVTVIASDMKNSATYYMAQHIALNQELDRQIAHPEVSMTGSDVLSYQDVWGKAEFLLYGKRYVIYVCIAAVLVVAGAAIAIVCCRRKKVNK